ncbi:glutathione S-transferase family protein [Bradyrhizobium sp. 83002]|uniref:glutathione S-transferase family protein n=1 Tax=Bradyrhizobium aeschynomenes TaxID=2734909 RepID=UPI001552084B|nr:glutathione S-transferase family protein [Bradyrhizobium aeschynomenes]NPU11267.1 glutathione S-transferase family protein [Bradyrhizobium aeschynomenes]
MPLKLFELVGRDAARPFSPYCWRTRMALAHKGLSADTIPWRFTEKSVLVPYGSERVPVMLDGDRAVVDSWAIANHLEDAYPDRQSLFGGAGGRAMARFINSWGDIAILGGISPLVLADIPKLLDQVDADYFRTSREARFGKPLEEVMATRDQAVIGFRRSLEPLRQTLKAQPFIGGDAPDYADYIVFGGFQWARVVSPFRLLEETDSIYAWRERLLDAFDGLARKSPGFPV